MQKSLIRLKFAKNILMRSYQNKKRQQNEMFVFGMPNEDVKFAVENNDYKKISNHLYQVQKISTTNYMFRYHLETQINDDDCLNLWKKNFYQTCHLLLLCLTANFKLMRSIVLEKINLPMQLAGINPLPTSIV